MKKYIRYHGAFLNITTVTYHQLIIFNTDHLLDSPKISLPLRFASKVCSIKPYTLWTPLVPFTALYPCTSPLHPPSSSHLLVLFNPFHSSRARPVSILQPSALDLYNLLGNHSPFIQYTCTNHFKAFWSNLLLLIIPTKLCASPPHSSFHPSWSLHTNSTSIFFP